LSWSRKFDEPIVLPDRKLITLREAADYITGLPKKEAALPEWQAAIEALMLVVEQRGPTMFARIAVIKALNRHVERVWANGSSRETNDSLGCLHGEQPSSAPLFRPLASPPLRSSASLRRPMQNLSRGRSMAKDGRSPLIVGVPSISTGRPSG
jgi:hypothetical protein